MSELKVGQILYSLNVGNAARNKEQVLIPVVVTKIGRKYFTAQIENKDYTSTQYRIDSMVENTNFSATSRLYISSNDYYNEKESSEICRELWGFFEYGHNKNNLSIDCLREIRRIVSANDTKKANQKAGL